MEMPFQTEFTLIEGPECGTYVWWQVELDDGTRGWVAEIGSEGDPIIEPAAALDAIGDGDVVDTSQDEGSTEIEGIWINERALDGAFFIALSFYPNGDFVTSAIEGDIRGTYSVGADNTIALNLVMRYADESRRIEQVVSFQLNRETLDLTLSGYLEGTYYREHQFSDADIVNCDGVLPNRLVPGFFAQVANFGAELRLRSEPTNASENVIANLGVATPMMLLGGVVCADGYRWWEIQTRFTGERGWLAEADNSTYFLEPISWYFVTEIDESGYSDTEVEVSLIDGEAPSGSLTEIASIEASQNSSALTNVEFSTSGDRLFVYSDGRLQILSVPTLNDMGSVQTSAPGYFDPVFGVSTDNNLLYVAPPSDDAAQLITDLQVWDIATGTLVNTLPVCTSFSWCQTWAFSPATNRGAVVVSLVDRTEVRGAETSPSAAAMHPDDEGILIFDLQTGQHISVIDVSEFITSAFQLVRNMTFSSDGSLILADVQGDGGLVIWDVGTGQVRFSERLTGKFALSSNNQFLAMNGMIEDVGRDLPSSLRIFSIGSTDLRQFPDYMSGNALAFTPDGRHIIATYTDGKIRIWDIDNEQEAATINTGNNQVSDLAISPDGQFAAIGFGGGGARIYQIDLTNGTDVIVEPTPIPETVFELRHNSAPGVAYVEIGQTRRNADGSVEAEITLSNETSIAYAVDFQITMGEVMGGAIDYLVDPTQGLIVLMPHASQDLGTVRFFPESELTIRLGKFGFSIWDDGQMRLLQAAIIWASMGGVDTFPEGINLQRDTVWYLDRLIDVVLMRTRRTIFNAVALLFQVAVNTDETYIRENIADFLFDHPELVIEYLRQQGVKATADQVRNGEFGFEIASMAATSTPVLVDLFSKPAFADINVFLFAITN